MRIEKLVLKNFSSFEGNNEFDFRIKDKEKNIILIGGQNGAGKTSLFSAIKIGLYGPMAFGYQGANAYYIQKIKECINSNVFQKDKVEAGIIIDIAILATREIVQYSISRMWSYKEQHLEEMYEVKKNGNLLDKGEIDYFQNYLLTIIPPGLFDFFMFDGEEVGNIFSTNAYSGYIKNSLFTMCDLDVFEVMRKYTSSYLVKADENEEAEAVEIYNKNEKRIDELKKEILFEEEIVADIENQVERLGIELENLETTFKKAGGITSDEKQIIQNEIEKEEKKKNEINIEEKNFIEGLMPFVILDDFVESILKQIDLEEKSEQFKYILNKINRETISGILKRHSAENEQLAEALYYAILEKFKPSTYSEDKEVMYDLSKEQKSQIYAVIESVKQFNKQKFLRNLHKKKRLSDSITQKKEVLRSAMSEEDSYIFTERENAILKQLANLRDKHEVHSKQIIEKREEKERLETLQIKCRQEILDKAQNKNIYRLTDGIAKVMKKVLDEKTVVVKQKLEQKTVEKLGYIYRKNNLITHIEIDNNFKFNLYQNEIYTISELLWSMKNYGNTEFKKMVGNQGVDILFENFGVNSLIQLRKVLEEHGGEKQIELYRKVELSRISKGERQIFILSIYWAIIEISGQKIPFIIDTPYARIDTKHRETISRNFFPNISEQVIILSTDEEVNGEYYKILRPFIAKEYLLSNDENANRTTILNKYFYEV